MHIKDDIHNEQRVWISKFKNKWNKQRAYAIKCISTTLNESKRIGDKAGILIKFPVIHSWKVLQFLWTITKFQLGIHICDLQNRIEKCNTHKVLDHRTQRHYRRCELAFNHLKEDNKRIVSINRRRKRTITTATRYSSTQQQIDFSLLLLLLLSLMPSWSLAWNKVWFALAARYLVKEKTKRATHSYTYIHMRARVYMCLWHKHRTIGIDTEIRRNAWI